MQKYELIITFANDLQREEMKKLLIVYLLMLGFIIPVQSQGIVRVGVMLPFKDKTGNVSLRALDFYRGIVLAVDSLKKDGTSFRIFTYNTATTPINTILNDTIIPHLDIIFGPDEKMSLKVLSDFTLPYGTKIVNAFVPNSEAIKYNPNFYVTYAPQEIVAEEGAQLINNYFSEFKTNTIIIDTKKVAHPFVAEIKKKADKVRFLQSGFTQNQLKSRLSKNKTNIIVLSSPDKESAVDNLEQIAFFKKNNPKYNISLLGYPEWEDYNTFLSERMFFLNTYIYTSFYNNVAGQRNKNYINTYNNLFKTNMDATRPVMAMFGFDCAYYMLKAVIKYGRAYSGQEVYAAPYQNGFCFKPYGNSGGMMNHFVRLVHYRTDQKIEMIDIKK